MTADNGAERWITCEGLDGLFAPCCLLHEYIEEIFIEMRGELKSHAKSWIKIRLRGRFLDFVYGKRTLSSNCRIFSFYSWPQNQLILPSFWKILPLKWGHFAVNFFPTFFLNKKWRQKRFILLSLLQKMPPKTGCFEVTLNWGFWEAQKAFGHYAQSNKHIRFLSLFPRPDTTSSLQRAWTDV